MNIEEEFQKVRLNNPLVNRMVMAGMSHREMVIALDRELVETRKRLTEFAQIAPRKYELNGMVVVWRCPEEMIPLMFGDEGGAEK